MRWKKPNFHRFCLLVGTVPFYEIAGHFRLPKWQDQNILNSSPQVFFRSPRDPAEPISASIKRDKDRKILGYE